jgi:hypothetical protein
MKASFLKIAHLISPALFGTTLLSVQPTSLVAGSPVSRGLPRFADNGKPGAAAPIEAGKFTINDLSADGNAVLARKTGLDVLTVRMGAEWSRPLRGPGRDALFVSFLLCATESTIVEIAGARLGVTLSPANGFLQFMFDEPGNGGLQWRSLGFHVPIGKFDGEHMVSLPLLTVHLDPEAGVWSLCAGMRLVADNLPLISGPGIQHNFTLKAGKAGAWVGLLVMSDENPLYVDDNANGIDDVFERQRRGMLLAKNANLAERKSLAEEWRTSQRMYSPPPLFLGRPVPDRE